MCIYKFGIDSTSMQICMLPFGVAYRVSAFSCCNTNKTYTLYMPKACFICRTLLRLRQQETCKYAFRAMNVCMSGHSSICNSIVECSRRMGNSQLHAKLTSDNRYSAAPLPQYKVDSELVRLKIHFLLPRTRRLSINIDFRGMGGRV